MKKSHFVITLAVLLCFVVACQAQRQETAKEPEVNIEADVAAIKASFDEFVQLYNAENFDRIMSIFYAENSVQLPPNESIRKGKEAILLGYQKDRELNIEHCDTSVVEDVRVSGELAVVHGRDAGTTTPRSGGESVKYSLKWLTVLERQPDGTWKWIFEMWNDNPLPETPEKEPKD